MSDTARELLRETARWVAAGEGDVPSPCVSVCRMDMDASVCEGCMRTLDEIAAWGRMGEGQKRETWAAIARRIEDGES